MTTLRWGILATGAVASAFARGLRTASASEAAAVASRSADRARVFASKHGIPRSYGTYGELLGDADVDAVYVATPNTHHAEWSIKAAEAGKHVVCEKPLALNHPEAMAVVAAAERNDVVLLEGLMYRFHPQTRRLLEIVASGEIGALRLIDVVWGFDVRYDRADRLYDPALGGGAVLDIGCYGVSFARLMAGVAAQRPFCDPVEARGRARLAPSGVDETALGVFRFPGDVLAQVTVSIAADLGCRVRIVGTEGAIEVGQPCWSKHPGPTKLLIVRGDSTREETVAFDGDLFALEADAVASNLVGGEVPLVRRDDSLGNMRALDDWRESIGLLFPGEALEAAARPVHGRPLAVRPTANMRYGRIPGVAKRASRLVLGTSYRGFMPNATVLLDDFFEAGGTCVDTAWVYGDGLHESMLGRWIETRRVREDIVVIGKGAHSPLCTPEHVVEQLDESLDRLRTDYLDVYCLHRDNEAVPVEEFVDVLNQQLSAGRIRAFGGSNWSLARVRAAQDYAAARGLTPMTVVSNQLSLARWLEEPWEGCHTAGDAEWLTWLEAEEMTLIAWSSQAQGFFARGDEADRSDPELVRCWYDEANFERLARARELARARGIDATALALAYVLAQPFPTFPIIGPATLAELDSSLAALDVELSSEERAWLDLTSGRITVG